MTRLFSDLNNVSDQGQPPINVTYSRELAAAAAAEAVAFLNLDIVYDDEFFDSLGLKVFTDAHHSSNDAAVAGGKLFDDVLQQAANKKKDLGDGYEAVASLLKDYAGCDRVVEMLRSGQQTFMKDEFRHNNGVGFRQGPSYKKMHRILTDTLVGLVESGKAVAIRKDVLNQSTSMAAGVQISRLAWATKYMKVKGRTCFNLGYKAPGRASVNDGVDLAAHDAHYPPVYLCNVHDLCELAMLKKARYPGEQISGATIDVRDAYQQGANSPAASRLYGTQVEYVSADKEVVTLWVFYVVGVFGFTRAGHVYNTFASAIDAVHNRGLDEVRSYTYCDDGILLDALRLLPQSVKDYCSPVRSLFGPNGVNPDKVKEFADRLEAIGWVLCFRTWRVFPSEKGRLKMLAYLFHFVPPGATSVLRSHLETLTGILTWYSACVPAGGSFVSSLFRCLNAKLHSHLHPRSNSCALSTIAQMDLTWWRAITLVACRCPYLIGDSIASIRKNKIPTRFLVTDASSTIGGGAALSDSLGGPSIVTAGDCIRWTRGEQAVFNTWGVTINVLEYFTVMYYVMLWSEFLTGRVVYIECDNTSAISWLLMKRESSQCIGAGALAKFFALFCLIHDVTFICVHIKGELNVVADLKSRSLLLAAQEADESILAGTGSGLSRRQERLRRLLYDCVTRPLEMHMHVLLNEVTALRSMRG